MENKKVLYIFLDEGGNFDFSPTGTKYFTLTSIMKVRPFNGYKELTKLKYDLIEEGKNIEYFHATEDRQAVRDKVFYLIQKYMKKIRIDSLIVEKRKTPLDLQEADKLYPEMLGHLLPSAISCCKQEKIEKIIIFTDVLPVQSQKKVFEKAVKKTLKEKMPNIPYLIVHHSSRSNGYLQFADYINWAIFRKWERGDCRSYDLIKAAIGTENDIFSDKTGIFY